MTQKQNETVNVLVFHDQEQIMGWLVAGDKEGALQHIEAGYPDLKQRWVEGTVRDSVVTVPVEEAFRLDLYEIVDWAVRRKRL